MRQVVQPADQPPQVATAVAVGVLEQVDLNAVDDRFLVPTIRHGGGLSPERRVGCARWSSTVTPARATCSLYCRGLLGAGSSYCVEGHTQPPLREWTAEVWVSDVVPYVIYGLVTTITFELCSSPE